MSRLSFRISEYRAVGIFWESRNPIGQMDADSYGGPGKATDAIKLRHIPLFRAFFGFFRAPAPSVFRNPQIPSFGIPIAAEIYISGN